MKIRYIVLIILLGSLLGQCRQPAGKEEMQQDSAEQEGVPRIEFEKVYHDFGRLEAGEVVSYSFTFRNTGTADLIVKDAHASCGCTVPKFDKEPIAPGEEGSIEVIFDSSGRRGNQYKSAIVKLNTPYGEKTLTIKANIVTN